MAFHPPPGTIKRKKTDLNNLKKHDVDMLCKTRINTDKIKEIIHKVLRIEKNKTKNSIIELKIN